MAEIEIDGEGLRAEAAELSFPRYPGTPGDARAIDWVAAKLGAARLEVSREAFTYDVRTAFRALRAVLLWAAALVALAGWLAPRGAGWAGASLGVAALAAAALPALVFLSWAPWLEKIYRRPGPTATANVVGRRPAPAPRLTLIFLAHHDSKSQNLTMPVRMGATLLALAGTAGVAVSLALAIAGAAAASRWWPYGCAVVAVPALLVLSALSSGNRSPGGVDNAGSVAIVLELARRLPGAFPPDVELVFLFPGAEEDHMVGAMRWLDAHRSELVGRPAYALNFDGAGAPGRLVLLEWFGFGRAFAPTVAAAARRAAAGLGLRVRRVLLPPAQGVDAIPFVHRGVECLTLTSGELGPAVWNVHSTGDRPELLDPEVLARVVRLAEATVHELLAGDGGPGSRPGRAAPVG
jgi:Peptidase family M28